MRDKLLLAFLLLSLILSFIVFYDRQTMKRQENQIKQLQTQLQSCQENYSSLLSQVELDRKKYEDKLKDLLKEARKSPKVITIPKVIERSIYISDEDCKKIGVMIDEAISELGK